MPLRNVRLPDGRIVTPQEAMEIAAAKDSDLPMTADAVALIVNHDTAAVETSDAEEGADTDYVPPRTAFSPTRLLDCARKQRLMDETPYDIDLDATFKALRGTLTHKGYEALGGDIYRAVKTYREIRLVAEFEGHTITGKPDLIYVTEVTDGVAHVTLVDYKTTGSLPPSFNASRAEHQVQLNLYAWLIEQALPTYTHHIYNRVDVDQLILYYQAADRTRVFKTDQRVPYYIKGEEYWGEPIAWVPRARMEAFMRARIALRTDYRLPPLCGEADRWRCRYCPVAHECAKRPAEGLRHGDERMKT